VISAIVGEQGKGKDGDLLAWRSTDGGKSWSAPVRVNDVMGSAREGLHAMASGGKDTLFAAWLDLRANGTRVYGASSTDGGATWSANRMVYESPSGMVCQCCHPSVTVDGSGNVFVMFRNSLEGSRDLYLTRSADGGKTFDPARKLGRGTWRLEACPMDGGALTLDQDGRVATVWRREGTLFVSDAEGPEKPLGSGRNPAAATTTRGTYGAWTEGKVVWLRRPTATQPEVIAEDGGFPSLATLADGSVVVAWESNGIIMVRPAE
jgi:BNR repeat protein